MKLKVVRVIANISFLDRLKRDKVPHGPWDLEEILRVRFLLYSNPDYLGSEIIQIGETRGSAKRQKN
jgi:hypothetical protein